MVLQFFKSICKRYLNDFLQQTLQPSLPLEYNLYYLHIGKKAIWQCSCSISMEHSSAWRVAVRFTNGGGVMGRGPYVACRM